MSTTSSDGRESDGLERIAYRSAPLKVGTIEKVRGLGFPSATVSEFRGCLGPQGARIYGLHIGDEPDARYVEVREDQLEVLSAAE